MVDAVFEKSIQEAIFYGIHCRLDYITLFVLVLRERKESKDSLLFRSLSYRFTSSTEKVNWSMLMRSTLLSVKIFESIKRS